MNHFPLFDNLPSDKANAISATPAGFQALFSGAASFIRFVSYQNGEVVIGRDSSYVYDEKKLGGERFPPLITGLEVKPGGSMGVLREGHVTVKFASIKQMEAHREFFRIGTPKAIVWGWTKSRQSGKDIIVPQGLPSSTAKNLVDNIEAWETYCGDGSKDAMVGPLIDFSYTINSDASIDATFVIGTKNEITAYLGTTKHTKTNTNSSTKDSVLDVRIARALELNNSEFLNIKTNSALLSNTINYDYANQGFWSSIASRISTWFDTTVTIDHDSYSDDVYISMDFISKYAINKNKTTGDYKLDIENAIAAAHKNIISNSENVIFPNATMANPQANSTGDGATLVLNTTNTQNFKLASGKEFPEQTNSSKLSIYNPKLNKYEAGKWGYIKNIFLKVDFVLDAAKSVAETGKLGDFVQKLCDEINVAACGLMELAPQVQANQNGKLIYTIVDYALLPNKISTPPTKIDLFSPRTTITDINFTSDLPKEIISMAMLDNQQSREIGKKLFFSWKQDVNDILNLNSYKTSTGATGTGNTGNGMGFGNIFGVNDFILPGTPGGIGPFITGYQFNTSGTSGTSGTSAAAAAASNTNNSGFGLLPGTGQAMANAGASIGQSNTLIDDNCVIIHSDAAIMTNGPVDVRAVLKDTALCKNLYFGNSGHNKNNPLLPIELEITVLGISGITIGKIVDIDVPFDNGGIFQVTEVTHTVDETWETKIKFRFRPNNT